MLQAYLVAPAIFLTYLVAAPSRRLVRVAHLAVASAVLLAVSLAWPVTVDLIPADQRPYVGSTQDNSAVSLAVGYNGLQRLLGRDGAFGSSGGDGDGPGGVGGGPVVSARTGSPPTSILQSTTQRADKLAPADGTAGRCALTSCALAPSAVTIAGSPNADISSVRYLACDHIGVFQRGGVLAHILSGDGGASNRRAYWRRVLVDLALLQI